MFITTSLSFPLPSPPIGQVSSLYWDHNDNFPQFSGCHALIPDGYMSILKKLAQGFEINYDCVVKHVEIVKGQRGHPSVRVVNTRGTEWIADKVRE